MKTLLDLDRTPTLEELRDFFRENDFSTAALIERDYKNIDVETAETLGCIRELVDKEWESLSREMGLKSHSSYYGKDNPLITMRDNAQNVVAEAVYKLIDEKPENAADILNQFTDENGEFTVNADELLHNAVRKTMEVMNYEEIAKVVQKIPAYEDFNHDKHSNHRAVDFDRKWNHTRAKTQTVMFGDLNDDESDEAYDVADKSVNIEEEVISNMTQESFWSEITDDDKELLRMRMNDMTQEEIAAKLGYKTHSAVTKRLQKLKQIFKESA
jgi:hypothetical protein